MEQKGIPTCRIDKKDKGHTGIYLALTGLIYLHTLKKYLCWKVLKTQVEKVVQGVVLSQELSGNMSDHNGAPALVSKIS